MARVVVCDNDDVALDLVVTDLTLEGHEIVGTCSQGEAAVEQCRSLRPDVLVVDLRMPPGIDGVATCRRVHDIDAGIRLVIFTNHLDERALDAARSLGAAYVVKGELRALRQAVGRP